MIIKEPEVISEESPISEAHPTLPDGVLNALIQSQLRSSLKGSGHHALLIAGPAGSGQLEIGLTLAKAWLCESPLLARTEGEPCGHCQSCRWVGDIDPREDTYFPVHPDLLFLRPEADDPHWEPAPGQSKTVKPSKEIKIKQVRDSASFVTLSAQRGAAKVVLVSPAEALNHESANSLLKMLEEPAGQCRFILVSEHLDWLLPTIRSRCQMLSVNVPEHGQALAWLLQFGMPSNLAQELLALVGGAAYGVLQLVKRNQSTTHRVFLESLCTMPEASLSQVSAQLAALEAPMLSRLLQSWISDLIRAKLGQPVRFFPVHSGAVAKRAQQTSLQALSQLEGEWRALPKLAEHPLNPRLYVEGLLLRYCELFP